MLKITVESDNPREPAVEWVADMLKYKAVGYKTRRGKRVLDGVIHMVVFEKAAKLPGKNLPE